jgi:hypothetical protein
MVCIYLLDNTNYLQLSLMCHDDWKARVLVGMLGYSKEQSKDVKGRLALLSNTHIYF